MPVAMVDRPSVIRTGASSGADGLAAMMRSAREAARMLVSAAVELSGPPIANGIELPSPMTIASTAELMKVAATP